MQQADKIAWASVAIVIAGIAIASLRRANVEQFLEFPNFKAMCVVINLDRNKERLMRIMTEYSRSDLVGKFPIRRFAAVDAKHIDVSRFVTPKAMSQIQTTIATGYRLRHHEMTLGAVGCFLSHISVMRMLLQDDEHDMYVIFEDDAVIPTFIYSDINNAIKSAPYGWEVLLLGYHYGTFDNNATSSGYVKLKTFWGTHGVVINKRGAQKIVNDYQNNKISMQVDSMMSLMSKRGNLNVYATKTMLVNPGSFGSDIQVPVKETDGIDPYDLEGFRETRSSSLGHK